MDALSKQLGGPQPPRWIPDVVFYHYPCSDGFTCYWLLHKALRWSGTTYFPINYSQSFPFETCRGKRVMFADFSLKRPDIIRLRDEYRAQVLVLDHHVSAERELEEFVCPSSTFSFQDLLTDPEPFIIANFDPNKCGAVLVYEWVNDRPFTLSEDDNRTLLHYVDARDRWVRSVPYVDEITAFINSHARTVENWDRIASRLDLDFNGVLEEGKVIQRYRSVLIEDLCREQAVHATVGTHVVPCVNVPSSLSSDACHRLLEEFPNAPFVASCTYDPSTLSVHYSLRSENGRMDVSEIAAKYSGGGHRNAAGYRIFLA